MCLILNARKPNAVFTVVLAEKCISSNALSSEMDLNFDTFFLTIFSQE
jgi:hypothetical protein